MYFSTHMGLCLCVHRQDYVQVRTYVCIYVCIYMSLNLYMYTYNDIYLFYLIILLFTAFFLL